jgi:hypothetical protein
MCQYGGSNRHIHAVTKLYVCRRPEKDNGGGNALERCFQSASRRSLRHCHIHRFRDDSRKNGKRPIVLEDCGIFRAVQPYFFRKAPGGAAFAADRFIGAGLNVPVFSLVTCLARGQVQFRRIDFVGFGVPPLGAV